MTAFQQIGLLVLIQGVLGLQFTGVDCRGIIAYRDD